MVVPFALVKAQYVPANSVELDTGSRHLGVSLRIQNLSVHDSIFPLLHLQVLHPSYHDLQSRGHVPSCCDSSVVVELIVVLEFIVVGILVVVEFFVVELVVLGNSLFTDALPSL